MKSLKIQDATHKRLKVVAAMAEKGVEETANLCLNYALGQAEKKKPSIEGMKKKQGIAKKGGGE